MRGGGGRVGPFRLELPQNSSVWQREGEGWPRILDALGVESTASAVDWLFDLRQKQMDPWYPLALSPTSSLIPTALICPSS